MKVSFPDCPNPTKVFWVFFLHEKGRTDLFVALESLWFLGSSIVPSSGFFSSRLRATTPSATSATRLWLLWLHISRPWLGNKQWFLKGGWRADGLLHGPTTVHRTTQALKCFTFYICRVATETATCDSQIINHSFSHLS